jgi:adenylate cyclase class 2
VKTEIEVKFLDVDFDQLRLKLTDLGAICEQPMRLMRRAIIETEETAAVDGFVRIRDEGDKVTLTYKQFHAASIDGAREIEVVVSSFEDTIAIFDKVGLKHKSFQESKRETWRLGDVEIVLDEWPWLKPYVEIEGFHEDHVRDVAAKLGFNWSDAVFGGATAAYQIQYPKGRSSQLINIPNVAFNTPVPKIISGQKENVA